MPTRRSFVIALAAAAATRPAFAAEPSAQDFLAGIYAHYKGKNAKGLPVTAKGAPARYFTPELAGLIEADAKAAATRKEVKIDVKDSAPDKATGTVTFKNFGKDTTVTLDLVKLKQGWRVDDIHMPSGSLRALFKKA